MMGNDQANAAPTDAPHTEPGGGTGDGAGVVGGTATATAFIGSGRQTPEEAAKERAAVAPTQVSGPGSGSRVTDVDGNPIESLHDLHDNTGETIVTLTKDVYEEHAAPGAPDRKIKKLLFHAGQQVPKSVLARHEASMKANAAEVERLASLPFHPDADGEGETKEGSRRTGSAKEGSRGRVPRRP
jgi:hypothetical protein